MNLPRPLRRAAARAKPLVPEAAWPVLLAIRSLTGDAPLVGLPAGRRVLVLSAHPDDECIGAAGTLAQLVDGGATVAAIVATSGDASAGSPQGGAETGAVREAEWRTAAALLGVEDVEFCRLPDGALADHTHALAAAIAQTAAAFLPDTVLAPWFLDGHRDHRAVTPALLAAGLPDDLEVWGYEVWTPLPPNRIVDISSTADRKRQALACHRTAGLAFDLDAMMGLSRYRSLRGLMGRGHAEAFLTVPLGELRGLAGRVEGTGGID